MIKDTPSPASTPSDVPAESPTVGRKFWGVSPNLDFLRAVAVTMVLVRHLLSRYNDPHSAFFQPQALGIAGVMFFFVHTSLVLMMSMERHERSVPFGLSYVSFMIRRVFRIYPLSILTVFVAVAISSLPEVREWQTILANVFLVQNIFGKMNVLGSLWSLPLEMQMYLWLPLLFVFVSKYGHAWVLWLMWPTTFILGVAARKFTFIPPYLIFVPCFLPGVIAYSRPIKRRSFPFWAFPLTLAILVIAYMSVYAKFKGQAVLGGPLCLSLGLLLPYFKEVQNTVIRSTTAWIAKYSYGIYLFNEIYLHIFTDKSMSGSDLILRCVGSLVATFVTSVILFHILEEPMIKLGSKLAGRFGNRTEPLRGQ